MARTKAATDISPMRTDSAATNPPSSPDAKPSATDSARGDPSPPNPTTLGEIDSDTELVASTFSYAEVLKSLESDPSSMTKEGVIAACQQYSAKRLTCIHLAQRKRIMRTLKQFAKAADT
eukprot:6856104-Ditylum_brightwellii.AAC.1